MSSSTLSAAAASYVHPQPIPPRDEVTRRTWQEKFKPAQPHNAASSPSSSFPSSSSSPSLPPPLAASSPLSPPSIAVVESVHAPGRGRDRRKGHSRGDSGRGRGRGGRGGAVTRGQGPNAQSTAESAECCQSEFEVHPRDGGASHPAPVRELGLEDQRSSGRGRGRRRGRQEQGDDHPHLSSPHPHSHPQPHLHPPSTIISNLTLHERANLAQSSSEEEKAHPHPAPSSASTSRSTRGRPPPSVLSSSHPCRPPPHSHSTPSLFSSSTALSQTLISRLMAHSYECCVCNELISSSTPIWSCSFCFVIVHHRCIERWYNTKRVQQGSLGGEVVWPCPGCLSTFVNTPSPYRCFCGKVVEPDFNPYITPHACGQPCGKMKGGNGAGGVDIGRCVHPCTLTCHPGPCAPCVVMLTHRCSCGKGTYQVRCGTRPDPTSQTCGLVCDKQLQCGQHRCERPCHEGPCGDCDVKVSQSCWCGAEKEERRCGTHEGVDDGGQPHFSCQHPCTQLLDCGHHRCELFCHAGRHPPCSRLPSSPQLCACGKSATSETRSDCRDPLPVCEQTCGRWLTCGLHRCERKCHDSECGECHTSVRRVCRCGHDVLAMPCKAVKEQQLRNEREVVERLEAGEPPLEEDEAEQLFVCDRPCKARLSCGKHGCPNRCCPPSSSHLCMRQCDKPLSCGHHRCDEHCHGQTPCPPCRVVNRQPLVCHCGRSRLPANSPCGSQLKCPHPCTRIRPCGHPCQMKCHPEECQSLAPCAVLTERQCEHGRTLKNIPCYAGAVSCGAPCKKMLSCSQHLCTKTCHTGPCQKGENQNVDVVLSCGQKCGKTRINCTHLCRAPCHPSLPCPDVQCDEIVVVHCPCGRRSSSVKCEATNFQAGQSSTLLVCDDVCEVEQRNARLRDLLSVDDSRPVLPYPSILMQAVLDRQLLDFCIRSEKKINDWLDDSAAPTKMFPSMKSDQRWLLHQLAAYYQLTAESLDLEPNRSVRLIRVGNSAIPSVSLSSATRTFLSGRTGKSAGARSLDERMVLHLVGLTVEPRLSVHDVRMMFHDWEGQFKLNWMDDDHVVAVLSDKGMRERIKERLISRGMWTEERDERVRDGGMNSDEEGFLCLYRKLRMTDTGKVQGAVRDRDRKKVITGSDGFTSVVTIKRGGDDGGGEGNKGPHHPAIIRRGRVSGTASSSSRPSPVPSSSTAAPAPRPIVSLTGLKRLQQLHAEQISTEDSPMSWRGADEVNNEGEQDSHPRPSTLPSTDHGLHSNVDASPASLSASSSTSLHSVVGLYVPPVVQVKRDNRWAALMDEEEEEEEKRGNKVVAGQTRKVVVDEAAEEQRGEDWLSQIEPTHSRKENRGKRTQQRHQPALDDHHSAW